MKAHFTFHAYTRTKLLVIHAAACGSARFKFNVIVVSNVYFSAGLFLHTVRFIDYFRQFAPLRLSIFTVSNASALFFAWQAFFDFKKSSCE